jgi:hypothetical protein
MQYAWLYGKNRNDVIEYCLENAGNQVKQSNVVDPTMQEIQSGYKAIDDKLIGINGNLSALDTTISTTDTNTGNKERALSIYKNVLALKEGVNKVIAGLVIQNNLNYKLTVNQPTCITNNTPGNCVSDGSIIFNVEDGVPPYSYSIDGINFIPNQPVFQNLCPGLYPTIVMDASGQTFNQNITLNTPPAPQIYTITLGLNINSTTFNVTVSPQLPIGASVSFDIVHEKNLTEQPQYSAYTWNNVVTVNKNMVSIPYNTTTNGGNTNSLNNRECPTGVNIQSLNTYIWDNVTMIQGDIVSGTISNPTPTLNLPINTKCLGVTNSYYLYLNDVTLNNCPCSTVTVINPPLQIKS